MSSTRGGIDQLRDSDDFRSAARRICDFVNQQAGD